MSKGDPCPKIIAGSQASLDSAVLWAALEAINDTTSVSVSLSISEREQLRRDKLKDRHEIGKLRLVLDEIAQEYQVDMTRYKFIK